MPGLEQLSYELDNRSVLKALSEINTAIEGNEKKATTGNDRISQSFQRVTDFIGRVVDRQYQANERLVQSIERRAAAEGKTNVDRLVSERDRLIKKLGDEEKQIDRVRVAYDKLIESEKKGSSSGGGNFGETVKRLIESPFRTATGATTGFLETLGPVGAGLAGVTTGAIAVAGAIFEMTKHFAESSESLINLSAASGIALGELDKLQAMSKLTGTDISSLARAGTTMAEALENGGEKGLKMQQTLAKLQVASVNFNGAAREGGQILVDVLEKLSHVTDTNQRLAMAADVFGPRVSKNLQPVIKDLDTLKAKVAELGFGLQDDLIQKGGEGAEKLHEIGLAVDQVGRYVGAGALFFEQWAEGAEKAWSAMNPLVKWWDEHQKQQAAEEKKSDDNDPNMQRIRTQQLIQQNKEALSRAMATSSAGGFLISQGSGEDRIKATITELEQTRQKALDVINASKAGSGPGLEAEKKAEAEYGTANRAIDANKNLLELISQRKSFTKELDDLQRTAGQAELTGLDRINAKYDALIEKSRTLGYSRQQEASNEGRLNQDRQKDLDLENKKLDYQLGLELRQVQIGEDRARLRLQQSVVPAIPVRELGTFGVSAQDVENSLEAQRRQRVEQAQQNHDVEVARANEFSLENGQTDERRKQKAIAEEDSKLRIATLDAATEKEKAIQALQQKGVDLQKKFLEDYSKLQTGTQQEVIKSQATFAQRISGLGNKDNPGQVIRDTYQIQIQEAQQLFALEAKRISAEEDGYTAVISLEKARKQLVKDTADAQNESTLKQMELEHQQFESLKKDVEGLYTTLLTKPKDFSKQFQATIRSAAVRPAVEGLSNLTAGVLRPIVYGEDGTGGLAGATRGLFAPQAKNPLQLSTDANTASTDANTQAVYSLAALLSATTGQPEPSAPIGTRTAISIPSFTRSTSSGSSFPGFASVAQFPSLFNAVSPLSFAGGGESGSIFAGAPSASAVSSTIDFGNGPESLGGSVSTSGFATPSFIPSSNGGGSFAPALSSIFGGGARSSAGGGFSLPGGPKGTSFKLPNLSALKDSFFNPNINTGPGTAVDASSMGALGNVAGVLTSPAAGALMTSVGMPLATAGLFGNNRGTGTGLAESAVGGALTGAGIGTMILPGIGTLIGAGVGAAAGALAGGIEMATGDVSPSTKAKQYAKQFYGITISNQTATQIAQIATSKYAGNVAVAVRSPEIRQMLGLYAAGTGQNNSKALSSTIPHGSALAEQGGALYQQATYQYGQAYTFQSPLPTLNGVSSQTYPSGNSPVNLSLNVDGKGAGDFMAGNVVTPSFVNDQVQSANDRSMSVTQNAALYQQAPGLITS